MAGDDGARFEVLEALRGIAALAITVWHMPHALLHMAVFTHHEEAPAASLYLAVDFFLVLSGFIMTHRYTFAKEVCAPLQIIGYRFARLWPLLAITLALNLFLVEKFDLAKGDHPLQVWQLFLWNPDVQGPNPPSWTVTWEFWMTVPFAFFIGKKTPFFYIALASLFGYLVLLRLGTLDIGNEALALHLLGFKVHFGQALRCGCAFGLGTATYKVHRFVAQLTQPGAIASSFLELALCAAVVAVVFARRLSGVVGKEPCFSEFAAPWVFAMAILVFAREGPPVLAQAGVVSWALRRLAFVGTISYSIYLDHWAVLTAMHNLGWLGSLDQPRVWTLLDLAKFWGVLLPAAIITYYGVEKPGRTIVRMLVDACMSLFEQKPDSSRLLGRYENIEMPGVDMSRAKQKGHKVILGSGPPEVVIRKLSL